MNDKDIKIAIAKICKHEDPFYGVNNIKFGGKNPGTAVWTIPDYINDLNHIQSARKEINTPALRVKYLNTLRDVVSRRLPKNKVEQPIVSDYDLVDAYSREHAEAIVKTFGLWKE